MINILEVNITPNPVNTGEELTIEIDILELFSNAKKYSNKYPHRYIGRERVEGRKYPYKYPRK